MDTVLKKIRLYCIIISMTASYMVGERKKRLDALKTHIQNIFTVHVLWNVFWSFAKKKLMGKKLNINKQWNAVWDNNVTNKTEVQQNTYMSREHKAYTYLRIYTMKYKNACIVYYVAVFLGYQVEKRNYIKHLWKSFLTCPFCTKIVWTWFALHYNSEK